MKLKNIVKAFALILIPLLFLTGCEITIEQSGSKIITNAPYEFVFQISKSSLETQGYKILSEDKNSGTVEGEPITNQLLSVYKEPAAKVVLNISNDFASIIPNTIANAYVASKKYAS